MGARMDPDALTSDDLARIFDHAIGPRPVALVSTIGDEGRPYLFPISWYSSACSFPPVQYFAVTDEDSGRGALLLGHVRERREFVLNAVDDTLLPALSALPADATPYASDFFPAGVRALPSVKVAAFRVAESPAQMECRVLDIVPVGDGAGHLVFGGVAHFHVRDDLHDNHRIDQGAYGAVGKLANNRYCRCRSPYRMRPGDAR